METVFETTDGKTMWISTDERWRINQLLKLKEENDKEVRIEALPKDNDGMIYCRVPASWVRIKKPIKRNYTDEQRQAIRERLMKTRNLSEN